MLRLPNPPWPVKGYRSCGDAFGRDISRKVGQLQPPSPQPRNSRCRCLGNNWVCSRIGSRGWTLPPPGALAAGEANVAGRSIRLRPHGRFSVHISVAKLHDAAWRSWRVRMTAGHSPETDELAPGMTGIGTLPSAVSPRLAGARAEQAPTLAMHSTTDVAAAAARVGTGSLS